MSTERVILCGNAPTKRNLTVDPLRLRMWGRGAEVNLKSDDLARPISTDIPSRFADLIEIATYVYVADQAITRGGAGVDNLGANWRRRLHFTIPVRDTGFWRSEETTSALVSTLSFLSEDEYTLEFIELKGGPGVQRYLPFSETGKRHAVEEVVLFSGGIDSLGGAVQEVVCDKRSVALVNHRPSEKLSRRYRKLRDILDDRARELGVTPPVHVPVHINKDKRLNREYTQRSRSFLYASIAATVAEAYELSRIRFYENGVVSLNLPLSPQVVGAKATRTTHPRVLRGFARILSLVADRNFAVDNPILWKTKSEVVQHIIDSGCGEAIQHSTSCMHTWDRSADKTHCGSCSQCIDRRFSVLGAGAADLDPADAYEVDLLVGPRPEGEDRTMLASYVETASRAAKLSATEFFGRYGEIARVVNHVDGSPDTVALNVYELYQRHGKQVSDVVERGISRYAKAIFARELPDSCLLRLACETALYPTIEAPAPAPKASPEPQIPLKDFVFRKKGQAWIVRYDGNEEFILTASKGAAYLYLLLTNQGHDLQATQMAFEVARVPQEYVLGDAGERSDAEAKAAYRARFLDIQEELAKAERDGDEAAIDRVREEQIRLADELKDRGWAGRPKKDSDDRERVRKSVGAAIRRAVRQIAQYGKQLAEHLQSPRLRCGNHPIYDPGTSVDWDL